MAHVKLDGGFMSLPINIKRGNPIPLDTTSIHYPTFEDGKVLKSALENAQDYAANNVVAYVGQIITVCEGVLENGAFKVVNNENSGVYYIADEAGTLVKLVNNEVYNDDKKEDLEIDYSKLIQNTNKDDGSFVSTIIIAPKSYKKGTSDLFINGIKYNNSEYTEITYTDGGGVETDSETCNAILFEAFAVVDGDEVTIQADYE